MKNANNTDVYITPDTILAHTTYCTVRAQESQYLFYNIKTDEMHLISPTGNYVYELCNGLSCVSDIASSIAKALNTSENKIHSIISPFLGQLVSRGILYTVTSKTQDNIVIV